MQKSTLIISLLFALAFPACQKCSKPAEMLEDAKENVEEKKTDVAPNPAKLEKEPAPSSAYSCSLAIDEMKHVMCVDFDKDATKEDVDEMCRQIQAQYKDIEKEEGGFSVNGGTCPAENRVGTCSIQQGLMVMRFYAPMTVEEAQAECNADPEHPEVPNPVFTPN